MEFFKKLADIQYKHAGIVILVTLIFTLFLSLGFRDVAMESDMKKMNPSELDVYKLMEKVENTFGSQDSTFILVKIQDGSKEGVYDIRDPKVLGFITSLQQELKKEEMIGGVSSIGLFFNSNNLPKSLEQSKLILSNIPGANNFFNKDYSASMILISSDLGGGEEKIKELNERLNEIIKEVAKPDGVEIYITGNPQIRNTILDLLVKDAVYTLSIAAILIFILLLILERSLTKSILVFSPLVFGLAWTLGIMGLLGIKLSVATVGIGAMILGLGIEYGVFIVSRYNEERRNGSSQEALNITLKEVGHSVIGSGTTTIAGFLALGLSTIPMLRDLGFSLALGITCALIAAVIINPSLIILEERLEKWYTEKAYSKLAEKRKIHSRRKK